MKKVSNKSGAAHENEASDREKEREREKLDLQANAISWVISSFTVIDPSNFWES